MIKWFHNPFGHHPKSNQIGDQKPNPRFADGRFRTLALSESKSYFNEIPLISQDLPPFGQVDTSELKPAIIATKNQH